MEQLHGNALVRLTATFEGHDITTLEVGGAAAWTAREVGSALGYQDDGKRLSRSITADWSDDFILGRDYHLLTGDDLAALKAMAPEVVDPRTPSLLLLTESGLYLATMLSKKPAGRRLRRWLADEVLPSLRRGELAAPGTSTTDATLEALFDLAPHLPRAVVVDRLRDALYTHPHRAADIAHELAELSGPRRLGAADARPVDVVTTLRLIIDMWRRKTIDDNRFRLEVAHLTHAGVPHELADELVACLCGASIAWETGARLRVPDTDFARWATDAGLGTPYSPLVGVPLNPEPAWASYVAWAGSRSLREDTQADFMAWAKGKTWSGARSANVSGLVQKRGVR